MHDLKLLVCSFAFSKLIGIVCLYVVDILNLLFHFIKSLISPYNSLKCCKGDILLNANDSDPVNVYLQSISLRLNIKEALAAMTVSQHD